MIDAKKFNAIDFSEFIIRQFSGEAHDHITRGVRDSQIEEALSSAGIELWQETNYIDYMDAVNVVVREHNSRVVNDSLDEVAEALSEYLSQVESETVVDVLRYHDGFNRMIKEIRDVSEARDADEKKAAAKSGWDVTFNENAVNHYVSISESANSEAHQSVAKNNPPYDKSQCRPFNDLNELVTQIRFSGRKNTSVITDYGTTKSIAPLFVTNLSSTQYLFDNSVWPDDVRLLVFLLGISDDSISAN